MSHHCSREFMLLCSPCGSSLRPNVKPYVARQQNDAADAESIREAVQPELRFVPTKTPDSRAA